MDFVAALIHAGVVFGQTDPFIDAQARQPGVAISDGDLLINTDGVVRPFIFQDRERVEFAALTEESDEAFHREKSLCGVRARYALTCGYWQFAVRTDFTT